MHLSRGGSRSQGHGPCPWRMEEEVSDLGHGEGSTRLRGMDMARWRVRRRGPAASGTNERCPSPLGTNSTTCRATEAPRCYLCI